MKHHDRLQKQHLDTAAQCLAEALCTLRSPAEMSLFLQDLCTPAEIEALVDRWRVAQLLERGLSYREIRELTQVSVTTIGRVARYMEMGAGGYRTVLDRIGSRT